MGKLKLCHNTFKFFGVHSIKFLSVKYVNMFFLTSVFVHIYCLILKKHGLITSSWYTLGMSILVVKLLK